MAAVDSGRSWFRRNVADRLEGGATAVLIFLMRLLPLRAASAFGGWAARMIGLRMGVNKRAVRNLKLAMPDLSDAEVKAITREMWDNVGRTAAELTQLRRFMPANDSPYLTLEGDQRVRDSIAAGRPIAFATAHYCNWEVLGLLGTAEGIALTRVYRPSNNTIVDRMINDMRSPIEGPLVAKGQAGMRKLIVAARKGTPIGIMYDQKLNEGISAPLFGLPAMTTPLPAQLAVRFGYDVYPLRTVRTKGCHMRVIIEPPLTVPEDGSDDDKVAAVTANLNGILEAWIRDRPGLWFWLHNRWGKWRGGELVR